MCLAGDTCLVGFQENESMSEHYCYSNDDSEVSGKGDTGPPPPNPACGLRAWGWEVPCMDVGALPGSEKDRRHLWSRRFCSNLSSHLVSRDLEGRKGNRSRCEWKSAVRV